MSTRNTTQNLYKHHLLTSIRVIITNSITYLICNISHSQGFNEYVTTEPEEFINKNATFRITVETRNKKISLKQKVQKIEQMNYLPIKGIYLSPIFFLMLRTN